MCCADRVISAGPYLPNALTRERHSTTHAVQPEPGELCSTDKVTVIQHRMDERTPMIITRT